jgi:hypothetical protein
LTACARLLLTPSLSSVSSDNIRDDAPANSEEIYTGPLDHRRFTLSTVASSEMLRGKDIKQRKLKFLLGKTEPVPPVPALPAQAQPRLNREEIMARRSVAVSAGLPRKRELAGLYQLIELEHKNAARPVEDYTTKPALYRIRVWCEDEAPPAYIKCFGWPFIWLVQDSELEVLWEVGSAADKMPFMVREVPWSTYACANVVEYSSRRTRWTTSCWCGTSSGASAGRSRAAACRPRSPLGVRSLLACAGRQSSRWRSPAFSFPDRPHNASVSGMLSRPSTL